MRRLGVELTIAGSILFCIAAFMPVSRVFAETNPARKLDILRQDTGGWLLSQMFFSAGATAATVGMGILAEQLRPRSARMLGQIATGCLLVGVAFWDWHVYLRSIDPDRFVAGLIPSWLFGFYSVLTNVGLVAFGVALRAAAFPAWIGISLIGFSLAFLAAFLAFGDLPPFFYYVLLIASGVGILRQTGPSRHVEELERSET